MSDAPFDVVTGAFGFTGRYITRRLLQMGRKVKTLTGRPDRSHPFGNRIAVAPFDFDRPDRLERELYGADTFYNTYWVRFPRGSTTFQAAVGRSTLLIEAARRTGVRRFVHVSITNPSLHSPLAYFAGKARVEKVLIESGLSYAIVRPTVVFGQEDILIHNIAWFLRRFPVFGIPGSGTYRLQPVYVDDVARLAVEVAARSDTPIRDAAGPEVFTFEALVRQIAAAVGSRARIVHLARQAAVCAANAVGWWFRDVTLTRQEVNGLMANLLVSSQSPSGETRFTAWLAASADELGGYYRSEVARHYR